MLLGLSILVASVSFICYRHPPSSWSFLQWLLRPSIQVTAIKKEDDAPNPLSSTSNDDPSTPKQTPTPSPLSKEEKTPVVTTTMEGTNKHKQALDRKAMPPPPLFRKPISSKPPSSPPPDPDSTPILPTFSLTNNNDDSEGEEEDLPPPSFPSLNSAQRARGPPRLNPLPTPTALDGPSRPKPAPTPGQMLPPSRPLPLPNRLPPSSSSSNGLSPATHSQPPSKPSKKVLLTPGHSPLDWARLTSSPTSNLRGLPPSTPYLKVPPSLLSIHNGRPSKPPLYNSKGERVKNDAWTVLGGKVYNITPYLPFHPGGEGELLRCAGKDGTRLFGEVHPWVNWEGMLEGCLVGVAVAEGEVGKGGGLEEMD